MPSAQVRGKQILNMEKLIVAKTGNEAMAEAMRQVNPDVLAAYPITPATEIVQIFAQFVADGRVHTEFVAVESEHSAMSACIGASAAGSRAMTATASQGLALMWEMLYIASALRLPIVMCVVNRSLSAPINIHCDHSDTMGARDSGWIQLYSENPQEGYDNVIQAVRIAEKALLPVLVTVDGFIISHAMERVEMFPDAEVKKFLGEYKPQYPLLDVDHPVTLGALDFTDYFFEHKRAQIEAMDKAESIVVEVSKEFSKKSGRSYELFEEYKMDDAEVAVVVIGSTAGTAKVSIEEARAQKIKAGLIKLRMFRPFPYAELIKALGRVKKVAVFDRSSAMNSFGGPVFMELRSALYEQFPRPQLVNFVYGLGGRDINVSEIMQVIKDLSMDKIKKPVNYLGVRE